MPNYRSPGASCRMLAICVAKASPPDQIPPREAYPFVGCSRHRARHRARVCNPGSPARSLTNDAVFAERHSIRIAVLRFCREDGERVFCRGWRLGDDGNRNAVLVVLPAAEHPSPSSLYRLAHEYELKDELDGAWAVRPLEFVRERWSHDAGPRGSWRRAAGWGATARPMEVERFLRLAISIAVALGKLHRQRPRCTRTSSRPISW